MPVRKSFAAAAIVAAAFAVARAEAPDARRILDSAGVKGGLVVHLGCGDGALTAALHANDGYLVHGLDRDAAKVGFRRSAIRIAQSAIPTASSRSS